MWGEMQSAIMSVAQASWMVFALLLCVHFLKGESNRSDTTALVVWCCADTISTVFSPALYKYVASGELDYATWYMAFVSLNCIAIFVINVWHEQRTVKMTKFCVSIIGLLLLISFLHTLRLLDWLYVTMLPQTEQDIAISSYSDSAMSIMYRYGLMTTKLFAVYVIATKLRITQRSSV